MGMQALLGTSDFSCPPHWLHTDCPFQTSPPHRPNTSYHSIHPRPIPPHRSLPHFTHPSHPTHSTSPHPAPCQPIQFATPHPTLAHPPTHPVLSPSPHTILAGAVLRQLEGATLTANGSNRGRPFLLDPFSPRLLFSRRQPRVWPPEAHRRGKALGSRLNESDRWK